MWQWNHLPDDSKWSLSEHPGYLRLRSLPASDDNGYAIAQYDQITGKTVCEPVTSPHIWLRVHSNFDTEISQFSYGIDGKQFKPLGPDFVTVFQLRTFQGVCFALFHYNTGGAPGDHADFNFFTVDEPRPRGLTKPIPVSQSITLTDLATGNALAVVDGKLQSVSGAEKATAFRVVDLLRGRIALRTAGGQFVSVGAAGKAGDVTLKSGKTGDGETFQWVDLQRGETLLLSLATHRYLIAPRATGALAADHPGPAPDRKDGSCFGWKVVRR